MQVQEALGVEAGVAAEPIRRRHLDAVEPQAVGAERAQSEVALGVASTVSPARRALDDEGAQARRLLAVARDHQEVAGAIGQRNQSLLAGEHPGVLAAHRLGAELARIEDRPRLDPRQRGAVELVAGERRQVLLLLRVGALLDDRLDEQRRRQRRHRQRRVAVGELFEDERVHHRRVLLAGAAVIGGDHGRGETELPELLEQIVVGARRLVAVARDRTDDVARELAHGVAGDLLLFGGCERDQERLPCSEAESDPPRLPGARSVPRPSGQSALPTTGEPGTRRSRD